MSGQRGDERLAAVAGVGGTFAATAVLSLAAALWIARGAARPPLAGPAVERRLHAFPEPRLQSDPRAELARLRHDRAALLSEYAWIDARRGLCRIPVDAAVEVLLERGFALAR